MRNGSESGPMVRSAQTNTEGTESKNERKRARQRTCTENAPRPGQTWQVSRGARQKLRSQKSTWNGHSDIPRQASRFFLQSQQGAGLLPGGHVRQADLADVSGLDLFRFRAQFLLRLGKVWVKHRVTPKWGPGKWKHGLKPAVSWIDFDPYPNGKLPVWSLVL